MLNITIMKRQGLGGVSSYYADGADDYYAKDGSAMEWQGQGAEALGLEGQVDQKQFKELLDGRLPDGTTMKRFSGERSKERIGYDFTFSAPKSVSLQALVHGDRNVLDAHNKAVEAALKEAESLAAARTTTKGKTSHEQTGNFVAAKFRHETSREVDPNLHTHAVVMNMTQRADGEWRALSNEAMLHSLKHLGNVYKATLAHELQNQGFELRHDMKAGTFELAHISPEQIAEFSKRSEQIEAQLAKQGLTRETATAEQKNAASLKTRAKKGELDREAVHREWQQRATELGIDFNSRQWNGPGIGIDGPGLNGRKIDGSGSGMNGPGSGSGIDGTQTQNQGPPKPPKTTEFLADKAVDFAIQKLTERQAIANRSQVFDTALAHGIGILKSDDVRDAITRARVSGRLIEEQPLYQSMNPASEATNKDGTKDNRTDNGPALTRQDWINVLVESGKTKDQAAKLVDLGIDGGRLKRVETRYTTQAAITREREILAMESRGRGQMERKIGDEAVKSFVNAYRMSEKEVKEATTFFSTKYKGEPETARAMLAAIAANSLTGAQAATLKELTGINASTLSQEQGQAVSLIATTQNRFIAVPGLAGTGKSYMTEKASHLLRESGYKVVSLAPYAKQVKALQEIGLESRTVASFLATRNRETKDKDGKIVEPPTKKHAKPGAEKPGKVQHEKLTKDHVVFIDEAGVIPARQMRELMKEIEKAGARAVFLGDTQQTKAIEAGRPLDQLLKAGMEHTNMTDIQRQKNAELLQAVRYAVEGKGAESLEQVNKVARVLEKKDGAERYAEMVKAYVSLSPADRKETLVITGTNESRKQINEGIQAALGLTGKGEDFNLLNRLDTTQAERRHSKYYAVGAKVIPEADYKSLGLERGKQYTVTDNGPGNRLTVKNEAGESVQFNPAQTKKLSVYSTERTSLAPGDLVKVTHNDRDPKLNLSNGDRFTVEKVTKDSITLVAGIEGGKDFKRVELDAKKPLYVALDYASTVHSAQGLTADRVLINLETGSRTTAKDVYYVAVSRARHEALVFTDNLSRLPAAIQRETEKFAALDLSLAKDGSKYRASNLSHQQNVHGAEILVAGADAQKGRGIQKQVEKTAKAVQKQVNDMQNDAAKKGGANAKEKQEKTKAQKGPELGL
jgi:conjugative relaxase-like TrwC/TraI family protein